MPVEELSEPPRMGQCSVTGKMFPEDELVTIQGQRVCAEGKAILLERLRAGELMPGEAERPTVMRRFGCILLDTIIIVVPFMIVAVLIRVSNPAGLVSALVATVAAAAQIIYFGQLHAARGQTVGKIAGKLRVVNLDGSPITPRTAYVRALAYAGPRLIAGVTIATGNPITTGIVSGLATVYALINVLCALFDRAQQRALHDRIAGTRVITLE